VKYLGIDYGDKRVGLAISDPLGLIANAYKTLTNDEHLLNNLTEVIKAENIKALVVGLPKHMNNDEGERVAAVKAFVAKLPSDLAVHYQDERLTTKMATSVLLEADVSRRNRKGIVDKVAATIILQTFLDSKDKIWYDNFKNKGEINNE